MRHPVSTPRRSGGRPSCAQQWLGGLMTGRVVGGVVLPAAPEHAQPGPGEDADGVRMITSAGAGLLVDVRGPMRRVPRIIGKRREGAPQTLMTSSAESHRSVLPRGLGDGSDSRFSGEVFERREPPAIVAEFRKDLRGVDAAGAREGHQGRAIGVDRDGVFDGAADVLKLSDQRLKDGDQRAHQVALCLTFSLAARGEGCLLETCQQVRGGAAARIVVGPEEGGQSLLAQPARTVWRGVAGECVFRRKSTTHSNSNRPLIPEQIVH
jgi:hypothetical protein